MLKNTVCAALLGATALIPLSADSHVESATELIVTPLGVAIAVQGNEALRTIRREARACVRGLKPAPLEALIQPVKREVAPTEVAQQAL